MGRVSKDPGERCRELIDVAERLFLERGYENTAVSDIVREVDVAQGTFYYYFRSKAAMLEAVVEKNLDELEMEIEEIISAETDPVSKLNRIINAILRLSVGKRELMEHIHEESNAVMHEKMERRTVARLAPLIVGVVEEGIAERRMNAVHPQEMVEFLLASVVYLFHQPGMDSESARSRRLCLAMEQILVRLFRIDEGSFSLHL
ncbi:MAG: TetR/AcrR family transcriptional regulator [Methanotrichaceae archaeon]|nr:TetR/AcrR family transcriptional regulator [Methanotrichaceae archaeon]